MTVTVTDVRKHYGSIRALDGVSFQLGTGITGLLGPNGAGKTTTMRILATLLNPTWGEATVCGYSIYNGAKEIRRLIGKVEQRGYTLVPLDLHYTKGRIKLAVYAGIGLLAALGGIVATARLGNGSPNAGIMFELEVIAVAQVEPAAGLRRQRRVHRDDVRPPEQIRQGHEFDAHLAGPLLGQRFLETVVERTNALRPDLVVVTTDGRVRENALQLGFEIFPPS